MRGLVICGDEKDDSTGGVETVFESVKPSWFQILVVSRSPTEAARQLIGPRGGLPTLRADLLRLAAELNHQILHLQAGHHQLRSSSARTSCSVVKIFLHHGSEGS